MQKRALRVLGPYRNRSGFRVIVVEDGRRKSITAKTHEQALALREDLLRQIRGQSDRSVEQALAEYAQYLLRERGILPQTAHELHRALERFLPLSAPLRSITSELARRLYTGECQRITGRGTAVAADTHRALLRRVRAFFRWAQEREYTQEDPFAAVQAIGKSRAGKAQLRIDEARKFLQAAREQAEKGDAAAVGVIMMLLLGLRCGEVLGCLVRDIDDSGHILWIPRGKTKNARRRLQLPALLRPLLLILASGKVPSALLFGTNRRGGPRHRNYLWFKVRALCAAAGVPRVCSHSLRGLHSTLALEAGATAQVVATALGHASFAVTARHYADPGALEGVRARRVAAELAARPRPEVIDATDYSAEELAAVMGPYMAPASFKPGRRLPN